jgi:hypothetical protein
MSANRELPARSSEHFFCHRFIAFLLGDADCYGGM